MAAISDFFFFGNATLWRTLLTHFWDHWHFYSNQCYKNAFDYYKNATDSEGVNTRGGEGVKYVPWVCSNCRGRWPH